MSPVLIASGEPISAAGQGPSPLKLAVGGAPGDDDTTAGQHGHRVYEDRDPQVHLGKVEPGPADQQFMRAEAHFVFHRAAAFDAIAEVEVLPSV